MSQEIPRVATCLWFDGQALEAAEFYCRIIPGSRIERVGRYSEGKEFAEPGKVMLVEFTPRRCAVPGRKRRTANQAVRSGIDFRIYKGSSGN